MGLKCHINIFHHFLLNPIVEIGLVIKVLHFSYEKKISAHFILLPHSFHSKPLPTYEEDQADSVFYGKTNSKGILYINILKYM